MPGANLFHLVKADLVLDKSRKQVEIVAQHLERSGVECLDRAPTKLEAQAVQSAHANVGNI